MKRLERYAAPALTPTLCNSGLVCHVKRQTHRGVHTYDAVVKCTQAVGVKALEGDEMKDSVHCVVCAHYTNIPAPTMQYTVETSRSTKYRYQVLQNRNMAHYKLQTQCVMCPQYMNIPVPTMQYTVESSSSIR